MTQFDRWAILLLLVSGCQRPSSSELAAPNDNRDAAGQLKDGVLTLELELREVTWRPEGERGAALPVQVLTERGKPATVPGPLIRVPTGTEIHLRIANPTSDSTLVLRGLCTRPCAESDSLIVAPRGRADVRFSAGAPGTYFYWGSTTNRALDDREWLDSQLDGAFIVDSAGPTPPDRVFVLGIWSNLDSLGGPPDTGETMVINGLAWPHTERFSVPVGDTLHWRVVNPSSSSHPMHLHGTYFLVDGRGDAYGDTLFPPSHRPFEVTELMLPGGTMAMRWAAARSGNWVFHCHFAFHVSPEVSFDRQPEAMGHHRMAGLVLGITATGPEPAADPPAARQLRLLVQQRAGRMRGGAGYGYVLQQGAAPAPDSVNIPGSMLLLTRGAPVAITVVNHLARPTAVHWHGIELESFADGVPDLSGVGPRLFRPIAPGDSFIARFTPPRAGTFIYHTHFEETEQIARGLYGPLLVLEPGQRFDPATDHLVVVGGNGPSSVPDSVHAQVNGSTTPDPLILSAGRLNRLRLISIDPDHRIVYSLRRDTTVLTWRPLARDGADLPPAQTAERRAWLMTGPGQTANFGVTPAAGDRLSLQIEAPFAEVPWSITLPFLVR